MEFPFQIGIDDQQTQEVKDHILEFVTGKYAPITEHTYTGRDGKKRMVDRVMLPKGCKVPAGAKFRPTTFSYDKNGTFYHTPLTMADGDYAKIIYIEDDKYKTCDSKEWLKWCKGASEEHTPLPDPVRLPNKGGMIKMMSQQAGESEVGKGAKWEKPQQIKREKKNSEKSS